MVKKCPLMEKFKDEVKRRKQEKLQEIFHKAKLVVLAFIILASLGCAGYFFLTHSVDGTLVSLMVMLSAVCFVPKVLADGRK
jgi:hypothetical protein